MGFVNERGTPEIYNLSLHDALGIYSVYGQANRGNLIAGWPHTSATVREKETGRLFVVDSWFGNNGDAPDILDETIWAKGWDPARDPLPVDN